MATLDYYGHSTFGLTTDDGTRVIIDPFFGDNPWTEVTPSEVEADFIFCTHGQYLYSRVQGAGKAACSRE